METKTGYRMRESASVKVELDSCALTLAVALANPVLICYDLVFSRKDGHG